MANSLTIAHPGVHATVGLPAWATQRAANRTPERLSLKHRALRPKLDTMRETGVLSGSHTPRPASAVRCGP